MDIKNSNQQSSSARQMNNQSAARSNSGNKSMIAISVAALVIVVLLVVGLFAWKGSMGAGAAGGVTPKADKFQAVFLTNGQVYFGKLSNENGKYVTLNNIYYLQVQQSVQPSTEQPAENQTADPSSQVSLTKLGKELHGPEDEMSISRDQVLFWENLKDDGTVVKAIKDYETNNQ